jgi:hypothetical protein
MRTATECCEDGEARHLGDMECLNKKIKLTLSGYMRLGFSALLAPDADYEVEVRLYYIRNSIKG